MTAKAKSNKQAVTFANALLAQMTVEEKVGQICQRFDIASLFPDGAATPPGMPPMTRLDANVRSGELGALLFVHDPNVANRYQRIAVEESRLKIPLLLGYDVIWGMRAMFPVPLGALRVSILTASNRRARLRPRRHARSACIGHLHR